MRDLTQGSITRHLIGMAGFIGLSLIFQTAYFIVDLYFVSRLGNAAIAGVSASGNVFFLALAASQLIAVGAMALVAQAVGRKDEAEANLISDQSISLSLLFMGLMLALGYAFGGLGVDMVAADPASACTADGGSTAVPRVAPGKHHAAASAGARELGPVTAGSSWHAAGSRGRVRPDSAIAVRAFRAAADRVARHSRLGHVL